MKLIDGVILVAAILIVAGVVALGLWRKKKGKSGCGCGCNGCSGCANKDACQTVQDAVEKEKTE